MSQQAIRPVMLTILDGFGWREDTADNAVRLARTPRFDRLWAGCPHGFLRTSGADVGLPDGQMGNSEVGHLNIGAGRVVMQDLPRIGRAIADGSIARAPALVGLIEKLKASGGTCHLLGLVSPGGVHSHQDHAAALARLVHAAGVPTVVHAFTDGRDTPPQSGAEDSGPAARGTARRGEDRHRLRPLFRHGPRQALGPGGQGLRHPGRGRGPEVPRPRRSHESRLRSRQLRRIRSPRRHRRVRRHARRRRPAVFQLPRRPGAGDPGRAARPRVRRLPPAPPHRLRRRRRDGAVQRPSSIVSSPPCSRPSNCTTCSARKWPPPGAPSCAPRRPKNTRTSPIS